MKKQKPASSWNTVTPLSRFLAMTLFITLPIASFFLGKTYQAQLDTSSKLLSINQAVSEADKKTYQNNEQHVSFEYPSTFFVNSLDDDKFSIALTTDETLLIKDGTDAPLFGMTLSLGGCTRPDIKQTYICEKTPADAITVLKQREYLVPDSIKEADVTIDGREGKQISGIIAKNPGTEPVAGSFFKATYFSNNSTKDGEYLFEVVLMEKNRGLERTYDQLLSTLKFTD